MKFFTKSLNPLTLQEKVLFLLVFIVFILFPTHNSSLDAYLYAADVKYNQELFSPHHLLYNAFIFLVYHPFRFFGVDVLLFSKIINATFSVLGLYVLYKILELLKISRKEKIIYTLIVAFSFSFWRYSTENETYIIPIFFSLLASYYYLNYLNYFKPIFIIISGLSAAIACLFHQIHFFWWLGLVIGLMIHIKKLKPILLYIFPAITVPLAYVLVLVVFKEQEISIRNLSEFVFHDFYTGVAKTEFGWHNFFFIFLNSIRTFFEVHPVIGLLIKQNYLFVIPLLVMFLLLLKSLKYGIQKNFIFKRGKINNPFVTAHLIILILQFLFAFYAVGNIEFMVIIPSLLVLTLMVKYQINFKILTLFAITLFIWNFSYAIYPNNHYRYYNDEVLLDFISEHPNAVFLVKNSDLLNKFYYRTGIDNYKNIVLADDIKSPKDLQKLFNNNVNIYTDIIDKPTIFNRNKVISANTLKINFIDFKREKILTYEGLYGTSTLYKMSRNKEISE